jgi:hypothetical protein
MHARAVGIPADKILEEGQLEMAHFQLPIHAQ